MRTIDWLFYLKLLETYLVIEQMILILYENNTYVIPYKKISFFLNIYFSFYYNISVFISLQRSKASSF